MSIHSRSAALGVALLLCVSVMPAVAAEGLARFTIEVHIDGKQSWNGLGGDHGNATISELYRIVSYVKAIGDPSNINTLAPDFAQTQMAKAAGVQRRVAETQARHGGPAVAQSTSQEDYMARQQALAAEMQKATAACGSDQGCLMQLAMRFSQQSTAILPPGAADAADVSDQDDPPEAYRYQSYSGGTGRPNEILVKVDNKAQGAYADVGGMVPWTETHTADFRGSDLDRDAILFVQVEYDLQDKMVYTQGIPFVPARGRYAYKDRMHGETVNDDSEISMTEEAFEWANEQLRVAAASGSRSTTIPPKRLRGGVVTSGAKGGGEIKVRVDWKFEPL